MKTISEGTWISTCFDDDAQCDALFYDVESSTTFCLSWDSPEELYSLVPDWLTSARDPNSNLRLFETDQISQSGIWGDWTVESRHVTESWGAFNVNNYYCSLIENNLDNNVFAAKHWVEVIPNSGKYTSDVEFKFEAYNYDLSRPDRIILDYAPTGSVGSSTYSVGLSASISDTGPSVGASISWSYTVDDITVHNYSNTANGLVDLVHEYTLWSDSSRETRCMSPGHTALSKTVGGVFNNGSYYGTDEFTVTFASSEKNLWEQIFGGSHWEYNTYSITLHPSILGNPKTITIHGNGGGYIDDNPEFHDYCEDYSWTFCQGTIVNLNYPEFFWGGHTLLGYSMHPVSGDIDYNVNDRLRISDSIELYCVWGD